MMLFLLYGSVWVFVLLVVSGRVGYGIDLCMCCVVWFLCFDLIQDIGVWFVF